jgi:type III secretion protein W
MSNDQYVPAIGSSSSSKATHDAQIEEQSLELEAEILATERSMIESGEDALFTPMYMLRDSKNLEDKIERSKPSKTEETDENEDHGYKLIDDITKLAKTFEKKNPEMNHRALLGMKANIEEDDSAETIYEKVRKYYKDEYLADEAFQFLEEITNPNMKLGKNIRLARMLLNQRHQREVRAGRNINETAQEYAKTGVAAASSLRELYKDVTGTPKDPASLFDELNQSFDFNKIKPILDFLLHSLGKDMKSKGPSISKQELARLFTETRTMQAILGIYRFFYGRMDLIKQSFLREDLELPKKMTFELLAKIFTKYIQERYPSPDKLLPLADELGINEEMIGQIIIFTQYRDAIRGVSPKLFRSSKHRQDLLMSLIETISELDDQLEEEAEEEEGVTKKGWDTKDTIE